jgi:hypothetical protein
MGVSDDGNDPVALTQTRCPCPRVQGSDQDCAALVVPGSAGFAAQFNLVGVRTSDPPGPVSAIESADGSSAKCVLEAQAGGKDAVCPLATGRPICAEPGQPDELVLGSGWSCDTIAVRVILTSKALSLVDFWGW